MLYLAPVPMGIFRGRERLLSHFGEAVGEVMLAAVRNLMDEMSALWRSMPRANAALNDASPVVGKLKSRYPGLTMEAAQKADFDDVNAVVEMLQARHPGLTPEAAEQLGNSFAYSLRR